MRLDLDHDTHGLDLRPDISAITPPESMAGTLTVHRREIRLVCERLLMVAGVPAGACPAARDFAVDCVDRFGRDALARLAGTFPGGGADRPAWTPPRRTGPRRIDAGGRSALLVGAPVLAGVLADGPGDPVTVHGLADADLLGAGALWAASLGLGLAVAVEGADARVEVLPAAPPAPPSLIGTGIEVPAEVWWPLYYASNEALSIDTDLSRLHTGMAPPPSGIL
ncbi:hypothetical protein [Actinomadura sp. WAC 06369]|uniref:hypothetical protein n=1 Tax=Actinomadura sp. WAC 06369 TaxID=2203193 RepID=UPI000F790417|nr:hypothetical protein [Actinomadura sp. WAC 06369]RSN45589.1 hypothetical protein DMH08_36315 [Actinomadura sp. WAC 06369]